MSSRDLLLLLDDCAQSFVPLVEVDLASAPCCLVLNSAFVFDEFDLYGPPPFDKEGL